MPKAKTPRTGTTTTRTTLTPKFRAPEVAKPEVRTDGSVDLHAEIQRRAYELYEKRGYVPGFEQQDWITAEQEVRARHSLQLA